MFEILSLNYLPRVLLMVGVVEQVGLKACAGEKRTPLAHTDRNRESDTYKRGKLIAYRTLAAPTYVRPMEISYQPDFFPSLRNKLLRTLRYKRYAPKYVGF